MQVKTIVELTKAEEIFVMSLAKGLRPTRAATQAGYSIAHARHLLAKPHLDAAIRSIAANLVYVVKRLDAGPLGRGKS